MEPVRVDPSFDLMSLLLTPYSAGVCIARSVNLGRAATESPFFSPQGRSPCRLAASSAVRSTSSSLGTGRKILFVSDGRRGGNRRWLRQCFKAVRCILLSAWRSCLNYGDRRCVRSRCRLLHVCVTLSARAASSSPRN